jgi:hypothetical protein
VCETPNSSESGCSFPTFQNAATNSNNGSHVLLSHLQVRSCPLFSNIRQILSCTFCPLHKTYPSTYVLGLRKEQEERFGKRIMVNQGAPPNFLCVHQRLRVHLIFFLIQQDGSSFLRFPCCCQQILLLSIRCLLSLSREFSKRISVWNYITSAWTIVIQAKTNRLKLKHLRSTSQRTKA